jgi:hypothetical protein|tara:strand:+ start:237 stop:479 length:243 start_codon:yes stop_codon:yes gene_type:complete
MIKIWFLLILISVPNAPSVKYMGSIYPTEDNCLEAQAGFYNAYENKSQDYKDKLVADAFCLPFEAFPVKGMNYNDSSFDT